MRTRTRVALAVGVPVGLLVVGAVALLGGAIVRFDYGRSPTSRAFWQRPDDVVAALELAPGLHVADLGAGDGYFTWRLAAAVGPGGRVHAVDVDEAALRRLAAEAERRGLAQVSVVAAGPDDARLPERAVDLIFLCNAYHHLDDRPTYFRRLGAALAPGGRIAVIELAPSRLLRVAGHGGHGSSAADVRRDLEAAGFVRERGLDLLPLQHFQLFRSAVAPAP